MKFRKGENLHLKEGKDGKDGNVGTCKSKQTGF